MARVAPTVELNVWTREVADEEAWEHHLTTSDLGKALEAAEALADDTTIATIYERGRVSVDGSAEIDHVMFWWSDNFRDEMGQRPKGRGYGWSEEHDQFVTYDVPGKAAVVPLVQAVLDPPAVQPARYALIHCGQCGLEMPQNQAHAYAHNVEVGRTSGTSRSFFSQTRRVSRRSSSLSTTQGGSRTSGRVYYKRENLLLCDGCYASQKAADGQALLLKVALYGLTGVGFIVFLFVR